MLLLFIRCTLFCPPCLHILVIWPRRNKGSCCVDPLCVIWCPTNFCCRTRVTHLVRLWALLCCRSVLSLTRHWAWSIIDVSWAPPPCLVQAPDRHDYFQLWLTLWVPLQLHLGQQPNSGCRHLSGCVSFFFLLSHKPTLESCAAK